LRRQPASDADFANRLSLRALGVEMGKTALGSIGRSQAAKAVEEDTFTTNGHGPEAAPQERVVPLPCDPRGRVATSSLRSMWLSHRSWGNRKNAGGTVSVSQTPFSD